MQPPEIAWVEPPLPFNPILEAGEHMFIVFYTEDVGFNVIVTSEEGAKAGFPDGIPTAEWFRERFQRYVADRLQDDGPPALEQMYEWPSPIMLPAE